jgi:hypothetical protein
LNHTYAADGTYDIVLTVTDDDGATDDDTASIVVDTTPPETNVTFLSGDGPWYSTAVDLNLTANDTLSGVNVTWYKIDEGNWTAYNGTITVDGEGAHTLYFYSIDAAGNEESERNASVNIDYTAPVTQAEVNGSLGIDGWIKDTSEITLNATDALSGVAATQYKIDDGDWQAYVGPFTFAVAGTHVITYYSVDGAGNREDTHNVSVKIDKNDPEISLATPEEGYIYILDRRIMPTLFDNTFIVGRFTIEATAADATSGIQYVEFLLNNEILWKDYAEPFQAAAPRNCLFDEVPTVNKLQARAYDLAGNVAETAEFTYIKIL